MQLDCFFAVSLLQAFDSLRQLVDAAVRRHVDDSRVCGLRRQNRKLRGQLLQRIRALARIEIDGIQLLRKQRVLTLSRSDFIIKRRDFLLLLPDGAFQLLAVLRRLLNFAFDTFNIFIVVENIILRNRDGGFLYRNFTVESGNLGTETLDL